MDPQGAPAAGSLGSITGEHAGKVDQPQHTVSHDIVDFDFALEDKMPDIFADINQNIGRHEIGPCIDPSLLQVENPTKTMIVPRVNRPCWPLIEYPVQAVILKEITDALGSFQMACTELQLSRQEINSFLHRHDKEPHRLVFSISQASLAYGIKFLKFYRLDEYVEEVSRWDGCYVDRDHDWPLEINYHDVDPSIIADVSRPFVGLPSFKRVESAWIGEPWNTERGSETIAISFQLAKSELIASSQYQPSAFRVDYFRVPAGSTVVGPGAFKRLVVGGMYTVVYPANYPPLRDARQYMICKFLPKDVLEERRLKKKTSSPEGHQEVVDVSALYKNTGGTSDSESGSDEEEQSQTSEEDLGFFSDAFNSRAASEAPWSPFSAQPPPHRQPSPPRNDPLSILADPVSGPDDIDNLGLSDDSDEKLVFLNDMDEALDRAEPLEVNDLDDSMSNIAVEDLVDMRYTPILQIRLPNRYHLIDPNGYFMNLDTAHESIMDGPSPTGFGGEYIIVPPGQKKVNRVKLGESELFRMTFDEPMAFIEDDIMSSKILEEGLHRFSIGKVGTKNDLEVSSKRGVYDLKRPLRIPETYDVVQGNILSLEPRKDPQPTVDPKVNNKRKSPPIPGEAPRRKRGRPRKIRPMDLDTEDRTRVGAERPPQRANEQPDRYLPQALARTLVQNPAGHHHPTSTQVHSQLGVWPQK